jgi:hypothetical protein
MARALPAYIERLLEEARLRHIHNCNRCGDIWSCFNENRDECRTRLCPACSAATE